MKPDAEIRVAFQPSGRTVFALPGTNLLEVAARAGIVLQTPCGGNGTCGKCLVRVRSGATAWTDRASHPHRLSAAQAADGWRLACATTVGADAVVEVPVTSLFEHTQKILTQDTGQPLAVHPAVTLSAAAMCPPTRTDNATDLDRLCAALGKPVDPDPFCLAALPGRLRSAQWQVQAVCEGRRLLDVLPANPPPRLLGIAFDLGTTTVVGTLIDLQTGREYGVHSALNGQIPMGDDVLSRIRCIRENPARLADLQGAAMNSLNEILAFLCREAGVSPGTVVCATLAGNTTMQQIVCGIDPSALGELPFTPAFAHALELSANALGLSIHPAARLYVFPQIGGFVGGDTVAGLLASGFDRLRKPTLLVDIGTNGEIALLHNGRILCASAAAGPAFEGARIAQGMRATSGAIEKVLIREDDVHLNVIGNVPPTGLCGTALIDAVAEMLRHGLLDETGRIVPPEELPAALPEALRSRIEPADHTYRMVLAPATGALPAVCLQQRDIRELQLASGAIRAAVDTLLQLAGLAAADLDAVLLAGAFGNFIRRNNAQRIGLLPPLPHQRIRFIGNASSMGAKMALLSVRARKRAEGLRARCTHVDLSADPMFQQAFSQAMLFPTE